MNARRVRRARKVIARDSCDSRPFRCKWRSLDGYFWMICRHCGRVA